MKTAIAMVLLLCTIGAYAEDKLPDNLSRITVEYEDSTSETFVTYRLRDEQTVLNAAYTAKRPAVKRILKQKMKRGLASLSKRYDHSFLQLSWGKPVEVRPIAEMPKWDEEIIIRYGEFWGYPVDLVYDSERKRATLRIYRHAEKFGLSDDRALEFLIKEVARFTTGEKVPVGKTGIHFHFKGKGPIWGPHTSTGPGYSAHCLFFAEEVEMKDGVLIGKGETGGYDGYKKWRSLASRSELQK